MQSFGDETRKSPDGGVAPHLTVVGGLDAITFYTQAFGAKEIYRQMAEDGKRVRYARLEINGGSVMLHDDFPEMRKPGEELRSPAGVILHLQVDDADAWFERAVKAGATASYPLQDMFWGDRYGHVTDPYGHTWSIASPLKRA